MQGTLAVRGSGYTTSIFALSRTAGCYCSQSCHLPDKSWQTVLCPLCPRTTTWEPFNQSVTFLRDTAAPLSKHPQHWLGERGKSPVLIISPRLNLVPLVDCANFRGLPLSLSIILPEREKTRGARSLIPHWSIVLVAGACISDICLNISTLESHQAVGPQ